MGPISSWQKVVERYRPQTTSVPAIHEYWGFYKRAPMVPGVYGRAILATADTLTIVMLGWSLPRCLPVAMHLLVHLAGRRETFYASRVVLQGLLNDQ